MNHRRKLVKPNGQGAAIMMNGGADKLTIRAHRAMLAVCAVVFKSVETSLLVADAPPIFDR